MTTELPPPPKDEGNTRLPPSVTADKKTRSSDRLRSFVVATLIVAGCLTAVAAPVALWARTVALDTDTYVDTVASLPQNADVSAALAQNVVDQVFAGVDIEAELGQQLPDELAFLAAPVAGAIREVAVDAADLVISSNAFQATWETINRAAHSGAVAVLTGRGNLAVSSEGEVVLDLTDAVTAVRARLEESRLGDILPPPRDEGAEFVLFVDEDLGVLRLAVDLLDMAYWALPIATFLALGAAVLLSRNRRRTWLSVGVGLAIAMAASLLLLDLVRESIVGRIEDPINKAGVMALWDQLFRDLLNRQSALLVLSLIIATAALVAGPYRWAVTFRDSVRSWTAGWAGSDRARGVGGDALGAFLNQHLAGVRLAGVAATLLLMFAWPRLTVGVVLIATIGLIIYFGLIEVVRARPPGAEEPMTDHPGRENDHDESSVDVSEGT